MSFSAYGIFTYTGSVDCAKKCCVSMGICILFERNSRILAFTGCVLNETLPEME